MTVLLVTGQPIYFELAHTSRMYYIGKVLNRYGLQTVIMPKFNSFCGFFKRNSRISTYFKRICLFFYMVYIIRRKEITHVFSRGFYMGLIGMFLSKLFQISSIFDFHGFVYREEIYRGHKYKPFLTKSLERLCIKYSDFVVTQTESNRDVAKNLNKNVILIENGIDLDEFINISRHQGILGKYSIPTSKPIVGFIGNWEKWMNIVDLLEASKYIDNVSFVIVGEGHDYKKYINKYKHHRNIFFTGRIVHMDALKILANFDICVAPHSKNTIMLYKSARKTLEYMAAGKPIIVSNVIGKEYFLQEGVNCLLYNPGDPKDLVRKIKVLRTNKRLQEKLALNNKKLAKKYSWEQTISRSGLIHILENSLIISVTH